MYILRYAGSGELFARVADAREAGAKLEHYVKHGHNLVMTYKPDVYRLVFIATNNHPSVAAGHIQYGLDKYKDLEVARKELIRNRTVWSKRADGVGTKGIGFELWHVSLGLVEED